MLKSIKPHDELRIRTREVVLDLDDRPHLLVEVVVTGMYFPHRAPMPFVNIIPSGDENKMLPCWWADVADDNLALLGYFPVDLPEQGVVEFGYGATVMGRVSLPFERRKVKMLDRKKLPDNIVTKPKHFPGLLDRPATDHE